MKNVIALAAGMCEGLGLGMNAMSSLITRGCMEMSRMGKLFGADQETFNGLAGVGDTFGTCLGPLSRNRFVSSLVIFPTPTVLTSVFFISLLLQTSWHSPCQRRGVG